MRACARCLVLGVTSACRVGPVEAFLNRSNTGSLNEENLLTFLVRPRDVCPCLCGSIGCPAAKVGDSTLLAYFSILCFELRQRTQICFLGRRRCHLQSCRRTSCSERGRTCRIKSLAFLHTGRPCLVTAMNIPRLCTARMDAQRTARHVRHRLEKTSILSSKTVWEVTSVPGVTRGQIRVHVARRG
jgi:hypothetical protein